jgi:hypothetical protein
MDLRQSRSLSGAHVCRFIGYLRRPTTELGPETDRQLSGGKGETAAVQQRIGRQQLPTPFTTNILATNDAENGRSESVYNYAE